MARPPRARNRLCFSVGTAGMLADRARVTMSPWGRHGFDGNDDPERCRPSVLTGSIMRWENQNANDNLALAA